LSGVDDEVMVGALRWWELVQQGPAAIEREAYAAQVADPRAGLRLLAEELHGGRVLADRGLTGLHRADHGGVAAPG
jgi:hypothetical protein